MNNIRRLAVFDVGKTNAKCVLVDAESLKEIAVETRANRVIAGPSWPHFDLEGLWSFFVDCLARFHREHGVDAISITTHGASAVLLDEKGELAAPMLDYEFDGPDQVAADYERVRPDFSETGSPKLKGGLNVGAQLYWQFSQDAGLRQRLAHIITYPQYWGYRLTGKLATDVTSLGCHTDLWNPRAGAFSSLVARLGLSGKMAPPRLPSEVLGLVEPRVAAELALSAETPVSVGIHDSNASLLPYLKGRDAPFCVVSTGTWVIAMAIGGEEVTLDPGRDTLINVNALGEPVPSARFMGGREFEATCGKHPVMPDEADRGAVLQRRVMLFPAVESGSGPFRGRRARWSEEPLTDGQRVVATSWYLALMTHTCLQLVGGQGVTIIEGPLARNPDYLNMLAVVRPEGVETALSSTGTSVGAALLMIPKPVVPNTRKVPRLQNVGMNAYADAWLRLMRSEAGDTASEGQAVQ
ncbi:MAG TPA: FGGY-family carbohydrate kinase [Devosiaceae bacterium]